MLRGIYLWCNAVVDVLENAALCDNAEGRRVMWCHVNITWIFNGPYGCAFGHMSQIMWDNFDPAVCMQMPTNPIRKHLHVQDRRIYVPSLQKFHADISGLGK